MSRPTDRRRPNGLQLAAVEAVEKALGEDHLFAAHASKSFTPVEILGRGGMGIVHRVRDTRLGRDAAMKVLAADLASEPVARGRFLRELEVTARLDHPGVPPVYEAGRNPAGELYMVMAVVEGETLEDRIERYHGSERREDLLTELLEALVRVAETLIYAHEQGVVHRDLKASNIMIGQFGEVYVMDWGLARLLGHVEDPRDPFLRSQSAISEEAFQSTGITAEGAVLGTLGAMPPEQIRSSPTVDGKADAFAFAALLTQVLTGHLPVEGPQPIAIVLATLAGNIHGPRDLDRSVPRTLDEIARGGLAYDAAERAPLSRLLDQLRCYLRDEPVPGVRTGLLRGLARLARKRPAALALILLGGFAYGLISLFEGRRLRAERLSQAMSNKLRLGEADVAATRSALARMKSQFNALERARTLARLGRPAEEVSAALETALKQSGRARVSLLAAARIALVAGQTDDAQLLLEECAVRYPPGFDALFELHRLQLSDSADGRTGALGRLLRRAAEESTRSEFSLAAEALRARSQGDHGTELSRLNEALRLAPKAPWLFLLRAESLIEAREYVRAQSDCSEVIRRVPAEAVAWRLRGQARLESGAAKAALLDFDTALRLRPDISLTYRLRSRARQEVGDIKSALEDIERYRRGRPSDGSALHRNAVLLDLNGKSSQALPLFKQSILAAPKDVSLRIAYAKALAHCRKIDEALEQLSQAANLQPGNASALSTKAALLLSLNRLPEALAEADRLTRLWPTKPDYRLRRGRTLMALNRLDEAINEFEHALTLRRDDPIALLSLSLAKRKSGSPAAALIHADRLLAVNPSHDLGRFQRALCLIALARDAEAHKEIDRLITTNKTFATGYLERGLIWQRAKQRERAVSDLRHAIKLDFGGEVSRRARAALKELKAH